MVRRRRTGSRGGLPNHWGQRSHRDRLSHILIEVLASKAQPCDFCDGVLESRIATVDWRQKGRLIVIEKVPALVCNRCGERYYAQAVMKQLEAIAKSKQAAKRCIKVPVARYETVS